MQAYFFEKITNLLAFFIKYRGNNKIWKILSPGKVYFSQVNCFFGCFMTPRITYKASCAFSFIKANVHVCFNTLWKKRTGDLDLKWFMFDMLFLNDSFVEWMEYPGTSCLKGTGNMVEQHNQRTILIYSRCLWFSFWCRGRQRIKSNMNFNFNKIIIEVNCWIINIFYMQM